MIMHKTLTEQSIAGFFGLGLRDAHQFEFGSSRGSQEKNELLVKK